MPVVVWRLMRVVWLNSMSCVGSLGRWRVVEHRETLLRDDYDGVHGTVLPRRRPLPPLQSRTLVRHYASREEKLFANRKERWAMVGGEVESNPEVCDSMHQGLGNPPAHMTEWV